MSSLGNSWIVATVDSCYIQDEMNPKRTVAATVVPRGVAGIFRRFARPSFGTIIPPKLRTGFARRVGRAALTLVVIAILVGIGTWFNLLDKYFVYFPDKELLTTPGDVRLTYEDVFLDASDGVRLHGWFVPGTTDVTLLWFHGNGGNMGDRVHNIRMLNSRLGVNVFIFDYRGYGQSGGSPSEKGF